MLNLSPAFLAGVNYSDRKLLTGFDKDALIACVLTVASAITTATIAATTNIIQLMLMR